MVHLSAIQILGLICLLTFSMFVVVVLVLECIGRFHCLVKRKKNKNDDSPDKSDSLHCCKRIGISSGLAYSCFGKTSCYCCWQEKDCEHVIALPNSRILNSKSTFIDLDNKTCVICLEELNKKQLIELECKHAFHESCIMNWLKRSIKCPLCNRKLNVDAIEDYSKQCDRCLLLYLS